MARSMCSATMGWMVSSMTTLTTSAAQVEAAEQSASMRRSGTQRRRYIFILLRLRLRPHGDGSRNITFKRCSGSIGGIERQSMFHVLLRRCRVFIGQVEAGQHQVGIGRGLEPQRDAGLIARAFGILVPLQHQPEPGMGLGIYRIENHCLTKFLFRLVDEPLVEQLASALDVESGMGGGVSLLELDLIGILDFSGQLPEGRLVIVALDAFERQMVFGLAPGHYGIQKG